MARTYKEAIETPNCVGKPMPKGKGYANKGAVKGAKKGRKGK